MLDRFLRAAEGVRIVAQMPRKVCAEEDRIELECQLRRVDARIQVAFLFRQPYRLLQGGDPAVHRRNDGIAHLEVHDFALEHEEADVQSFDIGILPEPDDEWAKGKGGYKALLYMAVALPVVASRVGVNPQIVVDGETGYCVGSDDEWVIALERLMGDAALRARMGAAGRRRVEERYAISVVAPAYASALHEVAARRSHA